MANFTPVRPGGVWVFNSILQPDEMEKFDANLLKCANFTDGSTHAPSGFVTVGGSGFQLDGTGHEIAPTGRMTVQAGGEIRLADTASAVTLPTLRVNGSAGDILLYVKSHISTLEVKSGAVAEIKAGGALDIFGSLTLKTAGSGSITGETGTTSVWNAGSTLTINGTENINGVLAVKSGGSLNVENAGFMTVQNGATLTLGATAVVQTVLGCAVTGTGLTFQAKLIHSGTGGRTVHRPYATLPNADADVTVEEDSYRVPQIITASRIYTARHTGTIPVAGERIRFHRTGTTPPSTLFSAQVAREDSTVLFTFGAEREGFCEIEYDGAAWQLVAGVSVAVGTSGYYDDVWV